MLFLWRGLAAGADKPSRSQGLPRKPLLRPPAPLDGFIVSSPRYDPMPPPNPPTVLFRHRRLDKTSIA